ncbi:MAG: glycosyltransferase family protein [Burkholderiales bacterium]|nr:glycosyltransferase family protein [Burkholderiales bacterium]
MAKKMKIVAIIEARMTSSRLPGKVLLEAAGKPMLQHLVERLKLAPSIDEIVIATTVNDADNELIKFCSSANIKYFRGSENDVMDRVIKTAQHFNADIIVEITGDCPIIDPLIVEQVVRIFKNNRADYVSNAHVRTYPDGMDVQVFSLDSLVKSSSMTTNSLDREHVTLHIRNNPEIFSPIHIMAPPEIHWPELGLTLDELGDYHLIKNIIEYFSKSNATFTCQNIVEYLKNNSELLNLNQSVVRKGDS